MKRLITAVLCCTLIAGMSAVAFAASGASDGELPYSTKYYLANKKLDVADEADEDTSEVVPGEVTNPTTGGDGSSTNVNYNPGTGR